jgi:hypothetical protein
MRCRTWAGPWALMAALVLTFADAQAFDESKYPSFKGQWRRVEPGDPVRFDPAKPAGLGQQAPLTPEYQAIFEAGLADLQAGGVGTDPAYACVPHGMPRMMSVYNTLEIIPTPPATYILIGHVEERRRIYTDGRDWPADKTDNTLSFAGYSIGRWIANEAGQYEVLEAETRLFRGPRALETTGLPLHRDNQTIVKERIYLDRSVPGVLHDEITLFDHAFTRPWTVTKNYRHATENPPIWRESICQEHNNHLEIAGQSYFLSAEGYLMPTKKDQPPPNLKYFKQSQK